MPRNQSFMLTVQPYKEKRKFVTRRNGWAFAKVGEVVNGCEKCQGLKKGEQIVKLGQHVFTGLRWEPLRRMIDDLEYGMREVALEGFSELSPVQFVEMYCEHNRCTPETWVQRMAFAYLIHDNDEIMPLAVPREIAVCPMCNGNLEIVECSAWFEDRRGSEFLIPDEISLACEQQPDLDDDSFEASEWFNWHYRMPYVDWLPVDMKVLKWFRRRFWYWKS